MNAREKLRSLEELTALRSWLRSRGKTLVLTNGCFDLLHLGHLRYLEAARCLGDYLLVAINSDRSVSAIKGPSRPIVPATERAELIAGLHCVDAVVVFDAPTPLEVVRRLQPDVLVKGADWPLDRIVGADLVIAAGGRVERIELTAGHSTSRLIERITARLISPADQV